MNKEHAPCGWRDDNLPEPDPREYEEWHREALLKDALLEMFKMNNN